MNNEITYGSDLFKNKIDQEIRSKKYIPYRVFPHEKYKKGSLYYLEYYDLFLKVLDLNYQNNILEFIYGRTIDGNLYQYLTLDLSSSDYRLEKDTKELYKKKTIINDDIAYYGAEIVYWFFMNNIDCFSAKYKGFWKFVDRYSDHRIADNTKYILKADIDKNGNYKHCIVIKNTYRTMSTKMENKNNIITDEFMKRQKEYDFHRIKDYHENRFNTEYDL